MKVITKNINTVGQLMKALSKLPSDAVLNPFGSECAHLVFDEKNNQAYIDEDFSWADNEELDEEL